MEKKMMKVVGVAFVLLWIGHLNIYCWLTIGVLAVTMWYPLVFFSGREKGFTVVSTILIFLSGPLGMQWTLMYYYF